MNSLLRLMCYVFCLILCSCSLFETHVLNMRAENSCKQQCWIRLQACKDVCVDICRICSAKVATRTMIDYADYVHEVTVQGGYVNRNLNSYRDPLQCRKVTCNCLADFNVCNQGCTGVIEKRLQPVPNCS